MRTSPVHYIAPSAISIVPNCNNSANDIAVTISRGTKIKVYSPRAGIGKTTNGEYQEWTLTGRNRRLADSNVPYTIYARLNTYDKNAYLVFAPMTWQEDGEYLGEWTQAYSYVTTDGLYVFGKETEWESSRTKTNCIFVRLGDVSLPDANNQRTVTLDTGILGTDQFNDEWALRPDELPLRIELGCTINDEDAGPTPYVYWGQSLVLTAMLTEGWTGTDIQRFDRWEIIRNSGDDAGDNAWNYPVVDTGEETEEESEETEEESEETEEESEETTTTERIMPDGQIILNHARGTGDDFNGAVSVTFTILAVGHNAETLQPEILKTATINIMAETVEKYELSLSENIVSYDPQTQDYTPADGVNVGIRATDQRGEVFDMTRGQIHNASLVAEYSSVGSTQWTALTFGGSLREVATANIATTAFALQQSVYVRLMRRITTDGQTVAEKELSRANIAFVRNGEDSKIREWIYRLNSNAGYNATTGTAGGTAVSGQTDGVDNCLLVDDFVPTGWSDDPTGVSRPGDVEWESWRDYDDENHRWGVFHAPVIHNRYAEDGVSYYIKTDVDSVTIPADSSQIRTLIRGEFHKVTGSTDTVHTCAFVLYTRKADGTHVVVAHAQGVQGFEAQIVATADIQAYEALMQETLVNDPTVYLARKEIIVQKHGDTGPKGDDAQEVNPNILLRTVFDRGLDFVLEAWHRSSNTNVFIDTAADTIVNGRKSIRLNAMANEDYVNFSQSLLGKLKANTWYTLSFNAFIANGGGRLIVSFYNLFNGTRTNIFGNNLKVILDGEEFQASSNGNNDIPITGGWDGARHTITFLTNSSISTETLNIQFYQAYSSSGTGNHSMSCICMPKLEEGRTATAYMAHESDLKGDNAPYNEHAYALSRSRTSHADGDLYQVNGVRWFPSAPDPRATHPYVWERIMHYTSAGVNDKTSYICLTGAVGAMGKLCYMAGEYRADVEYTSNDSQTVAVEVSGTGEITSIYYLNYKSNVVDGRHIGPTDSGQTIWVLGMSQYNLVRARYLFADFAQFGAAVVSGDWLISVHGTINGTAYEGKYTDPATYTNGSETKPTYFWFDPAYPNEDHAGKYKTPGSSSSGQWASDHHNFIPNYAVNLLTGKTYQNDAYVRGEVHATSGDFHGTVFANDGEFTGRVVATSGSFSGSRNGFSIKLDADNTEFSLNGPSSVSDPDTLVPHPDAITMQYFKIGDFRWNSGIGDQKYFVSPRITLFRPNTDDGSSYLKTELNSDADGVQFWSIHQGKILGETFFGLTGMRTENYIIINNPQYMPTRSSARVGQVYLDGETLKVKLI
jgi:hypothetical protein